MLRFGQLEIDLALREVRTPQTPLPVVGRSFDILVHLVRGNGEIVTKESILQSVWGSVQTRENSLHVHISALRKALGEHGDIKTISGVGYQLLPKLSQQKPSAESLTNLPLETSGLIGQDASLATVSTMLREHRIVTLTGPGGIGKTRLALAVARKLMQNYSDGTWVVQLASIVDGELVSSTLTATLGLDHFGSDLPSDRIAKALGSKQVLIVLDNCEHVIGAAANLAEKIIYATKSARILATSREALAIEGECVYHVPSLESPPVSNELDVPGLLGHSAVELFLSRAGQARAAYSRDIRALTAISAICRQLDGLPLAIELAAARVAFLGLAEVQDRLADRFNLLNNGRRTALPRQQTLRATLEWSYVLLSEPSRAVLRPLAVFAADFTLEAACAVAQKSGLSQAEIIEEISTLVAKSLIESIQKGSRHTYRLLESTRYYVMERLLDDGEGQAAKRNHAQFHLQLAQEREADWTFSGRTQWFEMYGCRVDDIRSAIDWSLSPEGDPHIAVPLVAASIQLWLHLGLYSECRGQIERVVPFLDEYVAKDYRTVVKLMAEAGVTTLHVDGPTPTALHYFQRAHDVARRVGDVQLQLFTLRGELGFHYRTGDTAVIGRIAKEVAELSALSHDEASGFLAARLVAFSSYFQGSYGLARTQLERILARSEGPKDDIKDQSQFDQRTVALGVLARVQWAEGNFDSVIETIDLAVSRALSKDNILSVLHVLNASACPLALLVGDLERAEVFNNMMFELSTKHGFGSWNAWARYYKGIASLRMGDETSFHRIQTSFNELRRYIRLTRFTELLAEQIGHSFVESSFLSDKAVRESIKDATREGQHWCIPGLLHLHGTMILRSKEVGERGPEVERFFVSSLALAESQGALAYALRAAISLAELWMEQGRNAEAVAVLESIYARFTEGLGLAPLKNAQRLLESARARQPLVTGAASPVV